MGASAVGGKNHGEDATRFIAEKVGELALAGEQGGIDLWRAVAERLDSLRAGMGEQEN